MPTAINATIGARTPAARTTYTQRGGWSVAVAVPVPVTMLSHGKHHIRALI